MMNKELRHYTSQVLSLNAVKKKNSFFRLDVHYLSNNGENSFSLFYFSISNQPALFCVFVFKSFCFFPF